MAAPVLSGRVIVTTAADLTSEDHLSAALAAADRALRARMQAVRAAGDAGRLAPAEESTLLVIIRERHAASVRAITAAFSRDGPARLALDGAL
jgi:hypothetical protein